MTKGKRAIKKSLALLLILALTLPLTLGASPGGGAGATSAAVPIPADADLIWINPPVYGDWPSSESGVGYWCDEADNWIHVATASFVWNPAHERFAATTVYTVTVTITPSPGFTLVGVPANLFKLYDGWTGDPINLDAPTNEANSGVFLHTFAPTGTVQRPSEPRNFRATRGNGQVTLNWDAPEFDGGAPIQGYLLQLGIDDSEWINVELGPGARSYTFYNMNLNVVNRLWLMVWNEDGLETWARGIELWPSVHFTDVPLNSWFYGYVAWAYARDITRGTSATRFSPGNYVTRVQFATFLHRLLGQPSPRGAVPTFPDAADIPTWSGARAALDWATSANVGVITGINEAGTSYLRPGNNITREQMTTMLYRVFTEYLGWEMSAPDDALARFTPDDVGAISSWARDAVAWAADWEVIGAGGGRINPRGNATRAQTLAMLHRALGWW